MPSKKINLNIKASLTPVLLDLAKTHERDEIFRIIIDYLTNTIKDSACSIFLVNPITNDLNLVASSHIKNEDFLKCNYKIGEGFTGWVFEHKKLLYIPDEDDSEFIKKIQPKPPNHVGRSSGGKPHETKLPGPFMAAPIVKNKRVIGVIRLPAVKRSKIKKEFSLEERHILETFAERLSESIYNTDLFEKQNQLIHTIRKIGTSKNIDELLTDIVEDIPRIVGGGGCSVFLYDGSKDKFGKREFILKATTSHNNEFLEFLNFQRYTENGLGLTAWVGTTGKSLLLNDIDDKEELSQFAKNDLPLPIHKKGTFEIADVGPFLAAPIKNFDNNDVLGIIRIPRVKKSEPFEPLDQELLESLANQLYLIIGHIKKKEELEKIRRTRKEKFDKIFSPTLSRACSSLNYIVYHKKIQDFIKNGENYEDIASEILHSLDMIYKIKSGSSFKIPLLKNFKDYEKLLFNLPKYRDHFIHQFQVFLVGSVIIDKMYEISKEQKIDNFADYFFKSLCILEVNTPMCDDAWLITSTIHDLAYPIEKSDDLINEFFKTFTGIDEKIVDKIHLEKIIVDGGYGRLIDELCDLYAWHESGQDCWAFKPDNMTSSLVNRHFKNKFYQTLLNERDHGILSALILLQGSEMDDNKQVPIIFSSALAIALHNKLSKNMKEIIWFEEKPLAFLLNYCDLIQEWGRSEKDSHSEPSITGFDVVYFEQERKIYVKCTMKYNQKEFSIKKIDEARENFEKLKSKDVIFELAIENTGDYFRSAEFINEKPNKKTNQ